MTLRMAAPTTNRLGIYTARIWVPVDLQKSLGKKEVVRSLGTRDPAEAKRRFKQVTAEMDAAWERHRAAAPFVLPADDTTPAPRAISEKEATALSGEFYRAFVARHEDNPGSPSTWEKAIAEIQQALPIHQRVPGVRPMGHGHAFHPSRIAHLKLGEEVRAFLDGRGDNLDIRSFMMVCAKIATAKRDAFEHLLRNARGDFTADPKAARFPPVAEVAAAGSPDAAPISADELLEKWKTLGLPKARTYSAWAGKLRMLMRFAGKKDVTQLTTLDVERWRDARIAAGISPKTVSLGDLAGVRNVLAWAKQHTSVPGITVNVAADVKQKASKSPVKLRGKSFSHQEAVKILKATLVPMEGRFSEARMGARRWVPWLCAYSGARIGEIAQMHSSRIHEHVLPNGKKYWCMEITPLDGDVKDNEARTIPLHSHLIDQGFIAYAKRRQKQKKPLFFDPERARGGANHAQAAKVGDRLREWIRGDLKIEGVQPNHAWRHRFETMSRVLDLREDLTDHITGHAGADVSAKYGDYLIEALSNFIEKMARYEVEG